MDNNIRKEQEFMTLLQKTLKQARDNGGLITRDEIMDNFASVSLEESQLAQVEEYLRTNKIVVSTQAGDVDALPEKERDFLSSYMEIIDAVPRVSDSVLDAMKISAILVTGVNLLGYLESSAEVEGALGKRVMDSMEDAIAAMLDDKAVDRDMEDLVNLVADKAHELAAELGRKVTPLELAGEGDVTSEQIMEAVRLTGGRIEDLAVQE